MAGILIRCTVVSKQDHENGRVTQPQPLVAMNPSDTLLSPPRSEQHEPDPEFSDFSPQPAYQMPRLFEQQHFVDTAALCKTSPTAESNQTL